MERMTPDTTDFNSLSKKQLVELVIAKYNDCFRLEEENKKLKHENDYRAGIVDILPKGKGHIAEETIKDLQEEIKKLEEENRKLKKECEENDYLVEDNSRWMKKCWEYIKEIKELKAELKKYKKLHKYSNGELLTYSGD